MQRALSADHRLLNVPMILDRRVLVADSSGSFVPDQTWHVQVRAQFESLYQFLLQRRLLTASFVETAPAIDSLVLTVGDLTQDGLVLWTSGAVGRWLDSFDRSPKKALDNYKILEVALAKSA